MRKPCLEPGCRALTDHGSRCPTHQADADRTRETRRGDRHQRGYTSAWSTLAATIVNNQPWCSYCGTEGTETNPLGADHVIPKAHGGSDQPANLVTACRICQGRKDGATRTR